MQNIKWFSVPRASLPDSVHGFALPQGEVPLLLIEKSAADGLAVGFAETPSRTTPAVLGLVESSRAADLFSWLSTFAPEAFPISQAFRVLSFADWEAGVSALVPRTQFPKDAIWPSLIVGEIIGQGEREHDIGSLPLSRVFASFTYAQARAYLLYEKNPNLIQECRQRLSQLEADASFVKRPISVSELSMMWESADGGGDSTCREIIEFVARLLDGAPDEKQRPSPAIFELSQLNLEHMASDSIEQRVLEFERVVGQIKTVGKRGADASLAVAALAMLVGRSTTHITLLDEFAQEFPTAVSWFGLLAGLIGPEVWDEKWLRLSTSVERLLRVSVSLHDPATADLCWIEYNWIRGLRQSAVWFKETPKLYPRVLSVEILPGVSCQLRLQDGAPAASKTTGSAKPVVVETKTSPAEPAVDFGKEKRVELLAQMKSELARVTETMSKLEQEERQQPDLFAQDASEELQRKPVATRKTTRKSAPKKTQRKSG